MLSKLKRTLLGQKEPTPNQEETPPTEKEPTSNQEKPLRTHYTQTEIEMIQNLAEEGTSNREIATKMNRSISGIKSMKHKIGLTKKIQAEIPTLTNRRDTLNDEILKLRIELSLGKALLNEMKKETTEHKALNKEYLELKKRIEYYQTHENQIRREIQTLIRSEADAIAIKKICQWLKIKI